MTFPNNVRIEPMPCTLCGTTRPLGSTGCNRQQCPVRHEWNNAQAARSAAMDELVAITEELGLYEMEAEELANKDKT